VRLTKTRETYVRIALLREVGFLDAMMLSAEVDEVDVAPEIEVLVFRSRTSVVVQFSVFGERRLYELVVAPLECTVLLPWSVLQTAQSISIHNNHAAKIAGVSEHRGPGER
jgi:hypothetical protein